MMSNTLLRIFALLTLFLTISTATSHNRRPRSPQDDGGAIPSLFGGLGSRISAALSPSSPTDPDPSAAAASTSSPSPSPTEQHSKSSSSSTSQVVPTTPSTSPKTTTPTTFSKSSTGHSTSPPSITKAPSTPTPVVVTVIRTTGGSTFTSVSSSTPPASSPTDSASLSSDTSQTSGITTKTKMTVIGVVVGIGGAILLGGLFIVAWRIWGRGKKEDGSNDGLMGYRETSSHGVENRGSGNGGGPSNPFQSTLESYHNPARGVNASSNF